jgi:hypothetical protein
MLHQVAACRAATYSQLSARRWQYRLPQAGGSASFITRPLAAGGTDLPLWSHPLRTAINLDAARDEMLSKERTFRNKLLLPAK